MAKKQETLTAEELLLITKLVRAKSKHALVMPSIPDYASPEALLRKLEKADKIVLHYTD